MSEQRTISEAELHAYLDGELDAAGRADVEAWLAEHADDAARIASWRRQREHMAALHADILGAPLPERLSAALDRRPRGSRKISWMQAAASLVLLLAGAIGGWLANDSVTAAHSAVASFVHHAVGAHVVFTREQRHAVEAKAGEQHLVRWLSGRVGRQLNPPDLLSAGYYLVGGRLVADDGAPAAQFMYEDGSKNRLTLYVRSARDAEDTSFRVAVERGVSAFYWIEKPYAYALVGKVERNELVKLGELVHRHLRAS
jgi:anti-sigma factor RsiW